MCYTAHAVDNIPNLYKPVQPVTHVSITTETYLE